jgi:hypothetical protein
MSEETDRHSKALDVELIADPIARAEAEAKNGIRQFDAVVELIDYFLSPDRKVRLRPSHLLHLHRIALEGISSYAGNYRPAGIEIHGSRHQRWAHIWCPARSRRCATTSMRSGPGTRPCI